MPVRTRSVGTPPPEAPPHGFQHFPRLPLEIRFRIWRYVVPERRIISAVADSGPTILKLRGRLLPPAVLQVCREAREEALKKYVKFRRLSLKNEEMNLETYAYISYSYDTLFLDYRGEGDFDHVIRALGPDCENIQSLAVDIDFHQYRSRVFFNKLLSSFARLKELLFVAPKQVTSYNNTGSVTLKRLGQEDVHPAGGYTQPWTFDKIFQEVSQYYPEQLVEFDDIFDKSTTERRAELEDSGLVRPWVSLSGRSADTSHLARKWAVHSRMSFGDNRNKDDLG